MVMVSYVTIKSIYDIPGFVFGILEDGSTRRIQAMVGGNSRRRPTIESKVRAGDGDEGEWLIGTFF